MSPIALDTAPSDKTEPVLSLNWAEYSPGTWKRALDENEIFYNLAGRKGQPFYPIYGSASFTIPSLGSEVSEQSKQEIDLAFKNAWLTLRNTHPSLLSYVVRDGEDAQFTRVYLALKSEVEASAWADSTCKSIVTDGSAIDWFNQKRPNCQNASIFLIHSREEAKPSFTVFLMLPHEVVDGMGTTHILHQIFEIAGRAFEQKESFILPVWGSEGTRLTSCLKVAANVPEEFSDIQKERLLEIQESNMALFSNADILHFPSNPPPDDMKVDRREHISYALSKEKSAKMIEACKNIAPGVTVNHVSTVATALALAELQPKRDTPYSARFLVFAMVNLRPFLRQPFNDPNQAVGAYCCIAGKALGIDAMVPGLASETEKNTSGDDFYELVIEARDHFTNLKSARCGKMHEQLSFAPSSWATWTPKAGADLHAVADPPVCNLPVSCLGDMSKIIASDYAGLHLTHAWVSSEGFGADVPIFSHTWDGKFELSSMFDNRYHTVQSVQGLLHRIADIMIEHLLLGEEDDRR